MRLSLDWEKGEMPEIRELEDIEALLAEKAPTWTEMWQQQGASRLLLRQLRHRFGTLDERTRTRVVSGDSDRLLEWGERILTAKRLEDVFGD